MKPNLRVGVLALMVFGCLATAAHAASAPPRPETGILALGLFVGGILGWGLVNAKGSLKAGVTVLGATLGGGPILFMAASGDARWSYPIGLILGLLALYAYRLRGELFDSSRSKEESSGGRGKKAFAVAELCVIIAVTALAAVWSTL